MHSMQVRGGGNNGRSYVSLSRREVARLPFLPRLIRSLRKRYIRLVHGDKPFVATYFDCGFIVRKQDMVGREIALQNFERAQLTNFIAVCRRRQPDCLIDIGAHFGLYSCVLLNANVVGKALLFEPDERNATLLRANLLINGLLDRATIHQIAVGREAGRSVLIRGLDSNTGTTRIAYEGTGQDVEVVALDEVSNFSGQTLAIKIDVEGFELDVLAGMQRTLRDNRGLVQIESTATRDSVVEFMCTCGYELTADFYWDLFFERK